MLSYAHGPVVPFLDVTIPARLEQIAAQFPDREALVLSHQNLRLTWSQLHQQSEDVAASLLALGLTPGDRVGIWSSNCLEWVLLQYACARARLVLVNVNPAYRA